MAENFNIRARGPREDLVGRTFGKLTVLEWAGNSRWACACECGRTASILTANLKRGNSTSCGCIRNISSSKRATKHGLYHTKAYKTWTSVKSRCLCPTSGRSYEQYGGRGITMDPVWAADPVAFVRDVGQPPTDNHTLDRIDNNKGYHPGNVRWATPLEQGSNKRNNRVVTFQGKTYTLSQLARYIAAECGVLPSQVRSAIEHEIYPRKRG